jgi:hypothetical protein
MSDPNDSDGPGDAAGHVDGLVSSIRSALASEASADARAAGAVACRAILGTLEPAATRNAARSSSSLDASPLGATPSGATLGSIPREQIVAFLVMGLRSLLGQGAAPTYRAPPIRRASADDTTG